jgi:hypothetical protein
MGGAVICHAKVVEMSAILQATGITTPRDAALLFNHMRGQRLHDVAPYVR